MTDLNEGSADVRWIELPPILDIAAASPLAARLKAERGGAVAIDASMVEKTGTQAVQVLLSASKSWQADEVDFKIALASEPFLASLDQIGLTIHDFHDMQSEPESDEL